MRMTTRRWMVAVAIVALAMFGVHLKRRRDYFLSRVQVHAREQATWLTLAAGDLSGSAPDGMSDIELTLWKRATAIPRQIITYHQAMAQKYRHAARYPWLPVEPDPPEPE